MSSAFARNLEALNPKCAFPGPLFELPITLNCRFSRLIFNRKGWDSNPRVEHGLFEKVHYRLDPLKYRICEHSQNLVDTNGRYHYCCHYIHGKSD